MQALTPSPRKPWPNWAYQADAQLHSVRDADKLGIELIGPEHDDVDASDFVEVHHD
jgi:hypothetical protein